LASFHALAALAIAALVLAGCLGIGAPPQPSPQEEIASELDNVSATLNEAGSVGEPALIMDDFTPPI